MGGRIRIAEALPEAAADHHSAHAAGDLPDPLYDVLVHEVGQPHPDHCRHGADRRNRGPVPDRNQLQCLLGRRIPGAVWSLRADGRHHARVHQSVARPRTFHNGRRSGRRYPALPPDSDDHAGGIARPGSRGHVPWHRIGFAAPLCDCDRWRADGGAGDEYLPSARALYLVREPLRSAPGSGRARGVDTLASMFQLKRILFPVDFSDRCRGAAGYVEALAGRFDAELILLHVVEAAYNSTLEDLHEIRSQNFDEFFGAGLKHLRVKKLVKHGEAAQKIIECASSHHADLIMIPTQGMGIYRRLILGSTSAKVLHDADCPVWTGVHLENAPALEAVTCQRIVCAVDLKPSNVRVLDWANGLAEEYQ